MITAVVVAIIGASGLVGAALINSRHAKEIRRQLTPADDTKTLAEVITEFNRDLTAIAVAFGLHDRDELRHRSAAPERNRRVD